MQELWSRTVLPLLKRSKRTNLFLFFLPIPEEHRCRERSEARRRRLCPREKVCKWKIERERDEGTIKWIPLETGGEERMSQVAVAARVRGRVKMSKVYARLLTLRRRWHGWCSIYY